jgi:uncharacterized membrane protein YsdA (DUF1294 family)/cold shock CspA family protein
MSMRGVIKRVVSEKGYGFIRVDGYDDVFIHVKAVQGGGELEVGRNVTFDLEQTASGLRATNAVLGRRQAPPMLTSGLIAVTVAAALTAGLAFGAKLSWPAAWLVVINVVTFAVYGWDKHQARVAGFRIPEMTLHALALIGGSPGALAGQRFFHHKTRKKVFQLIFWTTVLAHIIISAWYLSGG